MGKQGVPAEVGAGMKEQGRRRRLEWEDLWDPQEKGTKGGREGCHRGSAPELVSRLGIGLRN